jgi:Flp pilus assembly protein TadG
MHRSSARTRRGVATVEAAVVLPVAILLLIGTWEVGRMIEVQEILNNAAREGARQAASGVMTTGQVQQVVTNYLRNAGLAAASATVNVLNLTHAGVDPTSATQMDKLQVSVTIPFSAVRWSTTSLIAGGATNLTAQANWFSARGLAYPTNVNPPAGN